MYGRSIDVMNAQPDKDMIIEYAELVNVNADASSNQSATAALTNGSAETTTAQPTPAVENNNNIDLNRHGLLSVSPSTIKTAIHKQIESRTANGKRRITPMFIPLVDDDMT